MGLSSLDKVHKGVWGGSTEDNGRRGGDGDMIPQGKSTLEELAYQNKAKIDA